MSDQKQLDLAKMQEVPTGVYDAQLQIAGENQTLKLAITNNRAVFVMATTDKFDALSGEFEPIGNGVFMARLAGKNHTATQWWIFHPNGTATIKEVPDRGEKQTAKLTRE